MSVELNDKSLMPFGKHKGTEMANVPADYLLWLLDNSSWTHHLEVREYIIDNRSILEKEK